MDEVKGIGFHSKPRSDRRSEGSGEKKYLRSAKWEVADVE